MNGFQNVESSICTQQSHFQSPESQVHSLEKSSISEEGLHLKFCTNCCQNFHVVCLVFFPSSQVPYETHALNSQHWARERKSKTSRVWSAKPVHWKLPFCLIQKKSEQKILKVDNFRFKFIQSVYIYACICMHIYSYTHSYKGIPQKLCFSFHIFTIF